MGFEIIVKDNTPIVTENDIEKVSKKFLALIGYIAKGSSPDIPLKLFLECFIKRPDRAWLVDELAFELKTSRPTVYRHLNKLKGFGILEETQIGEENNKKRAYRMYSNLSKAWNFVEQHIIRITENYRKIIDTIQKTMLGEAKVIEKAPFDEGVEWRIAPLAGIGKFELRLGDNVIEASNKEDIETISKKFLTQIGYIARGSSPDIPLNLFLNCFLKRPDKAWLVDELAFELKTSRPTIYRHLNKLKRLWILEEYLVTKKFGQAPFEVEKAYYRLRHSNLSKAWNFTEAHVKVAVENYRKTVEHLQELIEEGKYGENTADSGL